MVIKPDPRVTTPNNCTCTSICRCGLKPSDCDPGNPISFYPESSTFIGEVLDWCNTGSSWHRKFRILKLRDILLKNFKKKSIAVYFCS